MGENTSISSAEMVYALPLTLPGELCSPLEATAQGMMKGICSPVTSFLPLPTRSAPVDETSVSMLTALRAARHMFVLSGGIIPSLAPHYQDPLLVLSQGEKMFQAIAVGPWVETVSIDTGQGTVEGA
jgi:hypothetical protein